MPSGPKHTSQDEDFVPWPNDLAARYRAAGYWLGRDLHSILRDSSRAHPERLAVVCGERRISYHRLHELVDSLAAGLSRLGVVPGDRVVVQMPNTLEAIQTHFALFRLGAVPVFALPGHRHFEISSFVQQTGAKAYIGASSFGDFDVSKMIRDIAADHESLEHIVLWEGEPVLSECSNVRAGAEGKASPVVSFRELSRTNQEHTPASEGQWAKVDASRVALLQLSGGSTGTPKLIPRTHDDYLYSVRRSAEICQVNSSTVYLVALPLAHNFPLSSPGVLGCLLRGGTVVLTQDASPEAVFALLARERVSMAAAVPALAAVWLSAARSRGLRFERLLLQVGGAKLAEEQAEALLDGLGCQLQQVFGMAEGLVCYTPLDATRETVVATQGRPLSPADELRVVDDQDRDVPAGATGHLLTRGPYTIRGYFRAAEHNRTAFTKDGFYRTGDIVSRGPEGDLVVVGRAKDQINRAGEKIAPAELERHLATHPAVRAAAVVGLPDEIRGECICAFIVHTPGVRLSREELALFLSERGVATFKIPDQFEFVTELPQTSVGKVDTKRLRVVRSQSEQERGQKRAQDRDEVHDADFALGVISEVAEVMKVDPTELKKTTNLLDMGLDSLHLMMLVERFRARGVEVSFMELAENPTVSDFERIVSTAQRSGPV